MAERFTVWLSDEEGHAVVTLARELSTSYNYVFRLAIRQHFGLDEPDNVTDVTRNGGES